MSTAAVLFFSVSMSIAIAAPPQTAVNAHKEGMRLAKANQVPEAIEQLEKAVKIDPEFAEAWADLGNTHLSSGSMDEAIRAFAQAVRVRGDFQIARYNLAYALRKTGSHAKAAEQYRVYLQRDPDDADAWYGLAESLRQAGESSAAAEAYEKYATVEKRPAQAKWVKKAEEQARAMRKASGGEPPPRPGVKEPPREAIAAAAAGSKDIQPTREPVVAKQKPAAATSGSKHVSFSSKPKKEEAVAAENADVPAVVEKKQPAAAAAAAVRAKRPEAFDAGLGALKSGDFEGALPRLESAAKEAPEDAMVLAALGSAHLGLRHGKEAELAYRRALATARPEAVPGIWFGIGEAMRVLGESSQALEAFDRVAKDNGASASIKAAAKERVDALR